MDLDYLLPHLGAGVCLVLVALLAAPYALIEGQPELVGAYYNAGPLGVAGALFLAVLGIVIFLSGVRGQADPTLVAGIMLAVGLTIFALTVVWAITMESTIIFSFPSQYSWLEYHPWASLAVSGVLAGVAGGYAAVAIN
ncbi:hypothetical protein EGH24_00540 [Halonotius terrestris]|uniref:Uncharacterized protein n=1 Tax=Halonotius terrestris TaxID=2487750 RepID=A0A8J8PEP9_9EURY|nr:hypothetical protein [Halonotius terrestris]TQQ83327.1 hypothetical protein EGH24_00540 [Halonotius terrestris]